MRSGWAANRLRVRSSLASNAMTVVVASVRLSADSVSKVKSMAKEHFSEAHVGAGRIEVAPVRSVTKTKSSFRIEACDA
jgi:nitrogen regulatory protein PII